MVAPLMAALEAAMMVKSLPVIPSKTSLYTFSPAGCNLLLGHTHIVLFVRKDICLSKLSGD